MDGESVPLAFSVFCSSFLDDRATEGVALIQDIVERMGRARKLSQRRFGYFLEKKPTEDFKILNFCGHLHKFLSFKSHIILNYLLLRERLGRKI